MHRRINDQQLPKERRKNEWDCKTKPVPAPQLDRTKIMVTSTSPWLPTATLRWSVERLCITFGNAVLASTTGSTGSATHALPCQRPNVSICRHAADPMASMRRPLEVQMAGSCHTGAPTSGRVAARQSSQHHGSTAAWATSSSFKGNMDPLRRAFREAILQDVVKNGITDDAGLQQLFDRWVQVNPVQHRPALALAIEDVQVRLDSPL